MNKCKYCGIEFKPDRRRPNQDHCTKVIGSKECYEKNKPKGKNHWKYKDGSRSKNIKKCEICGKKFTRVNKFQKTCSISCGQKYSYKVGNKKGYKQIKKAHETRKKFYEKRFKENPKLYLNTQGYMMIAIPGTKGKKYHRYIWELYNGKIPEGYVIHHKDRNKLNNSIDNLQLMTESEHSILHNSKQAINI
jgi:hypothetical protein